VSGEGGYLTLAGRGAAETRVEGSRFIALAAPAGDEEAARALLEERRRLHHDATHSCSAWKIGADLRRASDDGEPGGSAGAPILAALEGAGLSDCAVVVTRYYGGTKLGVGGLVRAYGGAAAEALALAPRQRVVPGVRVRIRYAHSDTGVVMPLLERFPVAGVEHGFAGEGAELTFSLPAGELGALRERLRDQSAGSLEAEENGSVRLYSRP
jgi:uncharacterized YigZ family protein